MAHQLADRLLARRLASRVDVEGRNRIRLDVARWLRAVEDVVGGVVDHEGIVVARVPRDRARPPDVDALTFCRLRLATVDVALRAGDEHDVRPRVVEGRGDRGGIAEV